MSHLHHSKNVFDKNNDFIHIEHKFSEDYVLLMDIALLSDMFLDLQKDIFHEYFSLLVDRLEQETEEKHVRRIIEHTLQELNAKLTLFADKIDKVDYFAIKGAVRVFRENSLIGALIGDTSMMIFRDNALYYAVSNDYDNAESIDLFSEFVEGEVLPGDEMILVGYDIHTVFDKKELKKFNELYSLQNGNVMDFLEEIIGMRIDMSLATYMIRTVCEAPKDKPYKKGVAVANDVAQGAMGKIKKLRNDNVPEFDLDRETLRYPVVVGVLGLVVVVLGIGLFVGLARNSAPEMKLSDGTTVTVDIASIQKDIDQFKAEVQEDKKSFLYKQIIDKLDLLDREKKWTSDVKKLRNVANESYQKVFNMIHITDLNRFDNKSTGSSSKVLAFSENEKTTLTQPSRVFANGGKVTIAGTKGAMIDVLDGDRRGTLKPYTLADDDKEIKSCTPNLLKNGIYCVTDASRLYNITKAGLETLTLTDENSFPTSIMDVGTFGRTNFYTMTRSIYDNQRDIYLMRYRNVVGSQIKFSHPTAYPVAIASGTKIDPTTMMIDTTFLMWDSGQVHQRYRAGKGLTLTDRPVKMTGGDNFKYSADVRVLTNENTRYIFLFDKENQTLTVYDTVDVKTNSAFAQKYEMKYLMRFNFNTAQKVVDIALDNTTANVPVMYLLTAEGVRKINMIDFLESIVEPGR